MTTILPLVPEFEHVRPDRLLITAGAARRHHAASVRPLTFGGTPLSWRYGPHQKPVVRIGGRFRTAEITLRPLFFRRCTPTERMRILLHEVWHIGPGGALADRRRHGRFDESAHRSYLDQLARSLPPPGELLEPGERRIGAWLRRPPSRMTIAAAGQDLGPGWPLHYGDADRYEARVEQL